MPFGRYADTLFFTISAKVNRDLPLFWCFSCCTSWVQASLLFSIAHLKFSGETYDRSKWIFIGCSLEKSVAVVNTHGSLLLKHLLHCKRQFSTELLSKGIMSKFFLEYFKVTAYKTFCYKDSYEAFRQSNLDKTFFSSQHMFCSLWSSCTVAFIIWKVN